MTMDRPSSPLLEPLVAWFQHHGRELPWRAADLSVPHPDPYAVLVSEAMLLQTQVATVIPYFRAWMARWPRLEDLARAPQDAVHKAWEGLGYYRRAHHLHAAAGRIAGEGWPGTAEGLRALPGLGPYSAAALAAIAFQWPEPALDGNAFRVLARLLGLSGDPRAQAPGLREWLRPALVTLGPSRLTQAIMELGALVCAPLPDCPSCPLRQDCRALQAGMTGDIPPPAVRRAPRGLEIRLLALAWEDGWLVLSPRPRGLLAGLWRWPALEAAHLSLPSAPLPPWTQTYTHRRERVHPGVGRLSSPEGMPEDLRWIRGRDLMDLPMGRRDSRLRAALMAMGDIPALDAATEAEIRQLLS
jgi:A/G-specific adenine glycosylase